MKYIVILWVIYSNGTADKKAMYEASTSDQAKQMGYKYMGQYVDVEGVESVSVLAKDMFNNKVFDDVWVKYSQPEQEEETTLV